MLDEYLKICTRNGNAIGTVETKRKKLRQFFVFLEGRNIALADLTSADISDFIVTLTGLKRVSIKVHTSVLSCFFQHLKETGIIKTDLSWAIPEPKIYAEESIPETWTNEELQKLLSSIDRTGGVGKRDYAMILLATMLGMRAGVNPDRVFIKCHIRNDTPKRICRIEKSSGIIKRSNNVGGSHLFAIVKFYAFMDCKLEYRFANSKSQNCTILFSIYLNSLFK